MYQTSLPSVVDAYLQVGHTHEDLDALFGVLSGHIAAQLDWNSPQEMGEHVQRRMVKHLSPTPVFTGLIREVRAWQKWLAPLDNIPVRDGITGHTSQGSSHFFAYCRRKDLPLAYARNVRPELCMDPNDVVVLEKEYMSSNDLRQPVFRFCHVGASWRLPTAPEEWHPRSKFTPEFVSGLNTLVELVRAHYPDKENAVMYLQSWLDAPRCPTHHPPKPKILTYQLQSGNAISVPIGTAIVAAVVEQSGYHKAMNVRRIGGGQGRVASRGGHDQGSPSARLDKLQAELGRECAPSDDGMAWRSHSRQRLVFQLWGQVLICRAECLWTVVLQVYWDAPGGAALTRCEAGRALQAIALFVSLGPETSAAQYGV